MKFCLSSRQEKEYLNKADEITVAARDYKQLFDLISVYPDKTINFIVNFEETRDDFWKEIKTMAKMAKPGNLVAEVADINGANKIKELGLPFFYFIPATTTEQAFEMKQHGATQVIPTSQLIHELPDLKRLKIAVRAFPTRSHATLYGMFESWDNGVFGDWIRPEDMEIYEQYIDVFDFTNEELKRERALYRIYAEQHNWPGPLDMLVKDLNFPNTANRAIDSEITKKRIKCGQKCLHNGSCKLCLNALAISSPQILNNIKETK